MVDGSFRGIVSLLDRVLGGIFLEVRGRLLRRSPSTGAAFLDLLGERCHAVCGGVGGNG